MHPHPAGWVTLLDSLLTPLLLAVFPVHPSELACVLVHFCLARDTPFPSSLVSGETVIKERGSGVSVKIRLLPGP